MNISDQIVPSARKNKYKAYAENGRHCYELVCIRDGSSQKFFDEGPHERDADGKLDRAWQKKAPSIGRQTLLRILLKRDEVGNPLFYAREPLPPVWHRALNQFIDVPVVSPRIEAASIEHQAAREDVLKDARQVFEANKKEAAGKGSPATPAASTPPMSATGAPPKGGAR